jgi:alpha-galactosidase
MKGLPMNPIPLKIAYIGGGSRDWARKLMIDVALCPDLTGEIVLYDIERFSIDSSQLKGEFVIRLWDIVRNG